MVLTYSTDTKLIVLNWHPIRQLFQNASADQEAFEQNKISHRPVISLHSYELQIQAYEPICLFHCISKLAYSHTIA